MKPDPPRPTPWRQRTVFHLAFVFVILLLGCLFSFHHGLRTGRYALMNEKLEQGRYLCEYIGYELQKASPDINALLQKQAGGPLGIGRVKAIWRYRKGIPVLEMAAEDIPPVPAKVIERMLEEPVHRNISRSNWAYLITHPMGEISKGDFLAIHLDCWVPLNALAPFVPHPDWPLWGVVVLLLGAYALVIHSLTGSGKE